MELPPNLKHGGFSAYQRYKCRCGPCQEHARAYARRYERLRAGRKGRAPAGVKHGKSAYSYYGCRCKICCKARSDYDAKRKMLPKEKP